MNMETTISAEPEINDAPRDFDSEAKQHGWTPKDDFKGDPAKWVDAETFVKRADEVMPFLKKQNGSLKRELDDLKRTTKQLAGFAAKAEQRAYARAMAELEHKHAEAVETGDVAAARKVVAEISQAERDHAATIVEPEPTGDDPETLRKELNEWIEKNDWYVLDDQKRKYADLQADRMGPAEQYTGGRAAWFDELAKRVDSKFSERPPTVTNGTGNRAVSKGGKSYADLPPEARRQCDRFMKQIPGFTKEQYTRDFDWSAS
jgi:hypothetical protein